MQNMLIIMAGIFFFLLIILLVLLMVVLFRKAPESKTEKVREDIDRIKKQIK